MRRGARFVIIQSFALWLCLCLICLCCTGLTQGECVARHALSHLGVPYRLGFAGPDAYDCSGLIRHCFAREGFDIPHSAKHIGALAGYREITDPAALMTGDIVCFDTVDDADPSDHVGVYLGGGQFVHASSARGAVVVSDLAGYYLERFTGARRVAQVWF